MRKFAFVVFDIENKITERFPLDIVTGLSGLGYRLELSTLSGDITDTLTKIVQKKQSIKLTVNLYKSVYDKYAIFVQWVQKYSTVGSRMGLEYGDGVRVLYTEGKVTEVTKTEKDEYNLLSCNVTFTPLTPFFANIENQITIKISSKGKSYPFRYPYSYGKNKIENNRIENPYILPIPITVKINGSISTPVVQLLNADGDSYAKVSFPEVILTDGQYILINSASKKIYYFDGVNLVDYTAETDPSFDTFLLAESGVSTISVSGLTPTDTGSLVGSWRQYSL